MIIMDRNTFHKSKYKIPFESEVHYRFSKKFANGVIDNDNLYIFGYNYKGIVKFNLLTEEFSVIDDFLKDLKVTSYNEKICLYEYIKVDDKLYLPFINANAVLELSLNDDKTKIHYIGDEKQRYTTGAWDGSSIWLAPRDGKIGDIVKWNLKNNTVKQYANPLPKDEFLPANLFDEMFKVGNLSS